MAELVQLYKDKLKTRPISPITKAEAVYLENGSLLMDKISNLENKIINLENKIINLENNNSTQQVTSTAERRIGTWVNGKPLYQKYFFFGALPSNSSAQKQHGIPNIEFIYCNIGKSFWRYNDSVGLNGPIGTFWSYCGPYYQGGYISGVAVNNTEIYIVSARADASSFSFWACLEYTKTTD